MKYEQEQEVLRFSFEGEFDNLSVMRIKDESIALIERFRPKVLKLDFADVTFVGQQRHRLCAGALSAAA